MATEHRIIVFSGQVQGVGFRHTAVHLARGFDLAGTVKNLPDGRVELTISGLAADIDGLIEKLREHFGAFIRNVESQSRPRHNASAKVHSGLRIVP